MFSFLRHNGETGLIYEASDAAVVVAAEFFNVNTDLIFQQTLHKWPL